MSVNQITKNITQIYNNSNIYIIHDLNLAIDAGDKKFEKETKQDLSKTINPEKIKTVILTHLHYDHIGCFDLFPNAKFYAENNSIKEFEKNQTEKLNYILNPEIVKNFTKKLHPISQLKLPKQYQIIQTPGHCKSSICIYDSKNQILYSGDTLFHKNIIGRTDLPNSNPTKIEKSLQKIQKLKIKILCPGHNY